MGFHKVVTQRFPAYWSEVPRRARDVLGPAACKESTPAHWTLSSSYQGFLNDVIRHLKSRFCWQSAPHCLSKRTVCTSNWTTREASAHFLGTEYKCWLTIKSRNKNINSRYQNRKCYSKSKQQIPNTCLQ